MINIVLTDEVMTGAALSLSALRLLECACDGSLLSRLEANTATAASRAVHAVSSVINTVQQCVPAFIFSAKRRALLTDKLLVAKVEELDEVSNTLSTFLQQCTAGDGAVEFTEATVDTTHCFLESLTGFPDVSAYLAPSRSDAVCSLDSASRIVIGIDPVRCIASHPRWLSRDQCNNVTLTLLDVAGGPVYGITTKDVNCAVGLDCVGWSVMPSTLSVNVLTIEVHLASDCCEAVMLSVDIGGSALSIPLTVSARAQS